MHIYIHTDIYFAYVHVYTPTHKPTDNGYQHISLYESKSQQWCRIPSSIRQTACELCSPANQHKQTQLVTIIMEMVYMKISYITLDNSRIQWIIDYKWGWYTLHNSRYRRKTKLAYTLDHCNGSFTSQASYNTTTTTYKGYAEWS